MSEAMSQHLAASRSSSSSQDAGLALKSPRTEGPAMMGHSGGNDAAGHAAGYRGLWSW